MSLAGQGRVGATREQATVAGEGLCPHSGPVKAGV